MAFRDNGFAQNEREKTELRDEVRALRDKNERLASELAEERRKDEETAAEQAILNQGKWKDKLSEVWDTITSPFLALGRFIGQVLSFPFVMAGALFSSVTFIHLIFAVVVLSFAGVIFISCWHEFEDPRDGYVTGKDFYPEHQDCGWEEDCTGSGNSRHCDSVYRCHTVPPRWTVDIGYQGTAATWDVEQSEYNYVQRGQWFCARDIFHTDRCVEPRQ